MPGLSGIVVELYFEEEPTPCNTLRTAGEGERAMHLLNSNVIRFRFPRTRWLRRATQQEKGFFQ